MTPEERRAYVLSEVGNGLTWMYHEGRMVERRAVVQRIRERAKTLAVVLSPDLQMLLDEVESPLDDV